MKKVFLSASICLAFGLSFLLTANTAVAEDEIGSCGYASGASEVYAYDSTGHWKLCACENTCQMHMSPAMAKGNAEAVYGAHTGATCTVCGYQSSTADVEVYVLGLPMHDGEYITEYGYYTDNIPTGGCGYAYYEDGVLTLNDFDPIVDDAYNKTINHPANECTKTVSSTIKSTIYSSTRLTIKLVGTNVLNDVSTGIYIDGDTNGNNEHNIGEGSLLSIEGNGTLAINGNYPIVAIFSEVRFKGANCTLVGSIDDSVASSLYVWEGNVFFEEDSNVSITFDGSEGSNDRQGAPIYVIDGGIAVIDSNVTCYGKGWTVKAAVVTTATNNNNHLTIADDANLQLISESDDGLRIVGGRVSVIGSKLTVTADEDGIKLNNSGLYSSNDEDLISEITINAGDVGVEAYESEIDISGGKVKIFAKGEKGIYLKDENMVVSGGELIIGEKNGSNNSKHAIYQDIDRDSSDTFTITISGGTVKMYSDSYTIFSNIITASSKYMGGGILNLSGDSYTYVELCAGDELIDGTNTDSFAIFAKGLNMNEDKLCIVTPEDGVVGKRWDSDSRYVYSVFDSNVDWIDYGGDVETEAAGAKEVVIKMGYLMTLNLDGGTGNAKVGIYSEGSVITLPTESNYSKEGYELVGWKHSNGTVYEPGASFTVPAESVTFTAVWAESNNTNPGGESGGENGGNQEDESGSEAGGNQGGESGSEAGGSQDDASGTPSDENQNDSNTGNNSQLLVWMVVMFGAVAIGAASVITWRKRRAN